MTEGSKWYYDSPLGRMIMTGTEDALTGLWFEYGKAVSEISGQKEEQQPVFEETGRWLDLYFTGRDPGFRPKLELSATPFRRAVWEILAGIPYGQTMTYGKIAEHLAHEKGIPSSAARAVGGAAGHNPVLLILPCHRVVGAGGRLTGYAGGLWRKEALLKLEGIRVFQGFSADQAD